MKDVINFALIGCGRISVNHIEALKKFQNEARLVAACDIEEAKARKVSEENNIDYYTNIDRMLDRGDINTVAICTPSGLHPVHGIAAAKRKLHVITEKPMATSLKKADELISACDENGVQLFVVKQNRLNSTLQLVRRAIDKGRFGRIYMAIVNVLWARPQSYYNEAKWRGTWEFDGGAFMNQASHYVDMLEWLIGPVDSVSAYTATLARKIQTEDSGVASIRFRSGTLGSINVTMLTYPKNLEGSITIIGENGTVRIGGVAVNKVEHWEFRDYDDDDKLVENSQYNPPNVYGFGHTGYYRNVIDVLKGKAGPDTDGREGRKSLELILGIYKSAREGKSIPLPLEY
jgi:UDP-N-acetyl-2-amino-2-deoxyglucuronate dehydrogenase